MDRVYAYLSNQFKQPGNRLVQLILIHILSFLFLFFVSTGCYICGYENHIPWFYTQFTLPSLYSLLLERPWTIITYSFVHKGFLDLFWDMVLLYLFGQRIRAITRSKHIFRLYCLGQLVGAMLFFTLYQLSPTFRGSATELIGPSAAIYAIMVAVCVLIPSLRLYCFFFALPLRYVTLALLVIALMHLPTQHAGYYLAQLGGALVGYIYARLCKNDLDMECAVFNVYSRSRVKMSVSVTKK